MYLCILPVHYSIQFFLLGIKSCRLYPFFSFRFFSKNMHSTKCFSSQAGRKIKKHTTSEGCVFFSNDRSVVLMTNDYFFSCYTVLSFDGYKIYTIGKFTNIKALNETAKTFLQHLFAASISYNNLCR